MKRKRKSETDLEAATEQIETERKTVNFTISEFTVEVLVNKLDQGEVVIPEYQRALVWKRTRQSRFIESMIVGLPIPYLFSADVEGDLEVIDGSQRLRTLKNFLADKLALNDLELLPALNKFRFSDLPAVEQKRFKKRSIRMIELSANADLAVRFELFNRINSGSKPLTDAEFRKGAFPSELYRLYRALGDEDGFRAVCPVSSAKDARGEAAELVLRFFAYADQYEQFRHDVGRFLNRYLDGRCRAYDLLSTPAEKEAVLDRDSIRFHRMVDFVAKWFPDGFRRRPGDKTTPRVRFEAISVGVHLALEAEPGLKVENLDWLESEEFRQHTRADGSNSGPRLRGRVEYVRDKLLGTGPN